MRISKQGNPTETGSVATGHAGPAGEHVKDGTCFSPPLAIEVPIEQLKAGQKFLGRDNPNQIPNAVSSQNVKSGPFARFDVEGALNEQERVDADHRVISADLQVKVNQIEAAAVNFPTLAVTIRLLREDVGEGNFERAARRADEILGQIQNIQSGVPTDLGAKVAQIEAAAVSYPTLAVTIGLLREDVGEGNFERAARRADEILGQIQNIQSGVPADLGAKVAQIEAAAVSYPTLAVTIRLLREDVGEGNFERAARRADEILGQIQNIQAGVPADLGAKVAQIEAAAVNFPTLAVTIGLLREDVGEGNFERAARRADEILGQIQNIQSGVPADLGAKIAQIEAAAVNFPTLAVTIGLLREDVGEGNFERAARRADEILLQINNLF